MRNISNKIQVVVFGFIAELLLWGVMMQLRIINWLYTNSMDLRADLMHKQLVGFKKSAILIQRKYRQHIHIRKIK